MNNDENSWIPVPPSMAEAARQVEEKGILKNAYKKFSKWKTENPKEYYFIKEDK